MLIIQQKDKINDKRMNYYFEYPWIGKFTEKVYDIKYVIETFGKYEFQKVCECSINLNKNEKQELSEELQKYVKSHKIIMFSHIT